MSTFKSPRRWIAPFATLLLALVALAASGAGKVLHRARSDYNEIIVTEDETGRRVLQFEAGGDEQSVMQTDDPDGLALAYTRATMAALALVERPRRVLMIGLGGGTMASFLHKRFPDMQIDCVEIDPAVVEAAKRFFGFKPDERLRVHVADGRRFVETAKERYDLIILDAYGADSIPLHLATVEFMRAVRARLTPGGAVAANVIEEELNPRYRAMLRALQESFDGIYEMTARANRILIALPRRARLQPTAIARRLAKLQKERKFGFDLAAMALIELRRLPAKKVDAQPLRDSDLKPEK